MTDDALNHFRIAYVFLWKKEVSAHSSILAWRIPWTEEPGGLQFIGSHRVGRDWNDSARTHVFLWPGILTVPPARRPLCVSSVGSTGWRTGIILPEGGIHRRGANTWKSVCPWWRACSHHTRVQSLCFGVQALLSQRRWWLIPEGMWDSRLPWFDHLHSWVPFNLWFSKMSQHLFRGLKTPGVAAPLLFLGWWGTVSVKLVSHCQPLQILMSLRLCWVEYYAPIKRGKSWHRLWQGWTLRMFC